LTLYKGRDAYTIDDAEPLRVFFEVREDLKKLALAQYFCELAAVLCPAEESAEEELRLLLNALHFLAEDSRPQTHIKAVTELRLLCRAGYMPAVDRCAVCGCAEFTRFSPLRGVAFCEACNQDATSIPLNGGAWAAMRHVVSAPFEKCFSFTVSDEALALFANAVERFLLAQLNRGFLTLDFYKSLG
jgi:DNA repair protein RecO (recombination protein O)